MNRRQFFGSLRSPAPSILEVQGQSFYMNFLDARVDEVEGKFLEDFRQQLRTVAYLVLRESAWFRRSDLQ
ncbi:MAG: hypothetical protein HY652_04905, partial [Acidobacteria bacterium]|nr:hypothetical protein [Acidobacteriota bacterium]